MKLDDFTRAQLFELLVEQLDGCLITDEKGRYIYVNRRWCDLTGYEWEDVQGMYVHDVMPDTLVDDVLQSEKDLSGEVIQLRTKNGEAIHALCSYAPLFRDGALMGCVATISLRGTEELIGFSSKLGEILEQLNSVQKELMEVRRVRYSISNIIGSSKRTQALKASIYAAARSASTVIIQGETGTGKELVAHSIHMLSSRAHRPFVKINCAAIPYELLESELFGYMAGAFTGASRHGKKGKFRLADRGTLFLDEINQMPTHLQPKLLRALQEKEVEPIGGTESIPVDCRIIAASNVPLERLVRAGSFRMDLFYRLNVVSIDVPPLRERKEDIPEIADALRERLNAQLGMAVPGISSEVMERLKTYDWPGNIRELQNAVERAMNLAWMDTLTWKHFEGYFGKRQRQTSGTPKEKVLSMKAAREHAERNAIVQALNIFGGNKTRAASALKITRAMLYRKLEKYGLE